MNWLRGWELVRSSGLSILEDESVYLKKLHKGIVVFRIVEAHPTFKKLLWWGEDTDYHYKTYGFRIFKWDIEVLVAPSSSDIDEWCCHQCGLEGADSNDGYYYVENGGRHDCNKPIKNGYAPDPPKGYEAYPKIVGYTSAYYNLDVINGHDWEEIHKCPVCCEEFSFFNSDY